MPLPGRHRARARRRGAAVVAGRRDAGRAIDRRAGEGAVRPPRAASWRRQARDVRAVHRADAHVGRRPRRARDPQGRRRRDRALRDGKRRRRSRPSCRRSSTGSRAPAARRSSSPSATRALGVDPPEGHRQGRHPRAVRGAARDGHQDRHDHRRQPADGRVDRRARPASTTSSREATPEDKMRLIKREQQEGKLVAMTGDGTNDAPALAQADVGVAMNTGTQAAKEAGNMVDLDSSPTKLIDIVEIGKQLLMTRGALTTFSIANDVAKYFAIIPAMFAVRVSGAGGAERHGAEDAGVGDPVGRHLQRAHHRRAGAAGAARRRVPGDERRGAAAPEPADLRRRRHHRAVRRHQDHRRHHHDAAGWRRSRLPSESSHGISSSPF